MDINENLISSDLQIEPPLQAPLTETAKWAKFISIAGFIFSGLIIIVAVYYLMFLNRLGSGAYRSMASVRTSAMIGASFYIVIALVWIVVSVFQLRFAVRMQRALEEGNQELLNESFLNLRIYYRISGIITIVTLFLSVIGALAIMVTLADKI